MIRLAFHIASLWLLAGAVAFAEKEEPGLHACNHVIDKENHDKVMKGLEQKYKDNNCDYHLPPVPPSTVRPGPKDPSKCGGIHLPANFAAAYRNTDMTDKRISPLLAGRVHKGDMEKNCGGAKNARGDRAFIANNVRGIQEENGSLPGGAQLQCVCKRVVDPKSVDEKGNPRNPLSLTEVKPPPERPAVPPDSRPPSEHIVRGPYVPPPMPPSDPPPGHRWELRWETSGGTTRQIWKAVPNSIGSLIIGA